MKYIILFLIASIVFNAFQAVEIKSMSKDINRLIREAMRNRDDIISLFEYQGHPPFHDRLDWSKEDLPSRK